ncbi:3-isopropylmalate dehydratase small subunit [Paraburkholderia unamae]|uniref:3-isopropylmalate dehydratase small subunit n=1 Tax=Paraburkholderia unamae TaxID=219649 RepID=UPI001CB55B85|nr:3-isopropylmalate dehydratase small subunit [Paraburkholderia unamae]CAG9257378.1 3-isopropylmalate dehydratase small subunit [Paraburkholderia unamae]
MQPLTTLDAVAVPLPAADIDTDQILPARFMHARRTDYGRYFFHDQRFDPQSGAVRPECVLNRAGYAHAQILVTGPNFGCGSSREQAVHTVLDFGIRAIVGTTFGDIFFSNCLKNGVLPIRADAAFVAHVSAWLAEGPGARVKVDLPAQRVVAPDGTTIAFEIDAFSKEALAGGLDEIDVTLRLREKIDDFERRHGLGLT